MNTFLDPIDRERRLRYRFLVLPYMRRLMIVLSLHLIEDEDEGVGGGETYRRWRQRAEEQGSLTLLEQATNEAWEARDQKSKAVWSKG